MAWNPSATLAHMLLAPEVSNTCSCVVSWSNTQSYVKRFSVCCSALRVLRRLIVECSGATLSSSPVWPFLFSCGMKGRQRMHTRTFLKLVSPAVAPAAVIAAALRDASERSGAAGTSSLRLRGAAVPPHARSGRRWQL